MKLPVSTWILIVLAVGLGGFVYYQEVYQPSRVAVGRLETKQLFNFKKEDVKQISIELPKETIELEKTSREVNPWQLKKPLDIAANPGIVIFLVDSLVNTKVDRIVEISPEQLKEYGLDLPAAKLKISLQNSERHELHLGRVSFDEQFIYALIIGRSNGKEKLPILLLPKGFQDGVIRETKEWKNKDLTEEDKKIDTTDTEGSSMQNKPQEKTPDKKK